MGSSSRWILLYLHYSLYLHRLSLSTAIWQDFNNFSVWVCAYIIDTDNFWKGKELGNSFSMLFLHFYVEKKVSTFLERKRTGKHKESGRDLLTGLSRPHVDGIVKLRSAFSCCFGSFPFP